MDGLDRPVFALLDRWQHHAQVMVRDLHQALEGMAEVDDQKQRARYRERENKR